jgi:hypothetical protein
MPAKLAFDHINAVDNLSRHDPHGLHGFVGQARRREVQEGMERQFKQSMTAPDWDMEDYDW